MTSQYSQILAQYNYHISEDKNQQLMSSIKSDPESTVRTVGSELALPFGIKLSEGLTGALKDKAGELLQPVKDRIASAWEQLKSDSSDAVGKIFKGSKSELDSQIDTLDNPEFRTRFNDIQDDLDQPLTDARTAVSNAEAGSAELETATSNLSALNTSIATRTAALKADVDAAMNVEAPVGVEEGDIALQELAPAYTQTFANPTFVAPEASDASAIIGEGNVLNRIATAARSIQTSAARGISSVVNPASTAARTATVASEEATVAEGTAATEATEAIGAGGVEAVAGEAATVAAIDSVAVGASATGFLAPIAGLAIIGTALWELFGDHDSAPAAMPPKPIPNYSMPVFQPGGH